jgi:hypothetical protein
LGRADYGTAVVISNRIVLSSTSTLFGWLITNTPTTSEAPRRASNQVSARIFTSKRAKEMRIWSPRHSVVRARDLEEHGEIFVGGDEQAIVVRKLAVFGLVA